MRILANLNVAGTLDIDTVTNAGADTDRFLVQDATGLVRYRTGAEVASDIGAAIGYVSTVKHLVKLGENISKGQAVYVSSSDGTNMIVMKASNASEATSSKTLGLLETGGVTNDQVYVVTEGLLAGLNTSTANAGDTVWLGTDGNLIFGLANKPYAPAHMVFIGIVTRVQQNNGEIFVKVQNGFELQELHNVQITTTPADNTVLSYETSTSLYKMKSISTLLGFTPFANPMTTLGDVIYGGASGVATRLAGNTTTTKQYLSQTGTGSASAAPAWASFNTDARAAISLTTNGTSGVATYDNSTGVLNIPNYVGSTGIRLVYSFTATASQTTFTVTSYTPGLIDVFYNGSRLNESEYTATNGTTIVLNIACKVNDIVDIVVYQGNITGLSGVAGAGTANQITYWTGTNTIGALSTSTYPSLTELSYVKGVTSSIQAQLDAKQPLFGNQSANVVYAGPATGSAASPTFRSLVVADLPSHTHSWSQITSTPTTISGYGITDAYTKTEVDSFLQGLDPKASVKAATTGAITLSGTQTIDDVALVAGDRVLVKDQSPQTTNGIYVVSASGWSRSSDMDAGSEFPGAYVFVEQGTANADKGFVCTNNSVSIGSTAITFVQFSGGGAYQAVLNGTGFVRMTGTSLSYITGTSSQFVKADGTLDGTSYQPLLTNPVTGSGTLNYHAKFTANGSTIGNSIIFDDGTYVGISTATPAAKLNVVGGTSAAGGISASYYTIVAQDPTSMAAEVGGSILFQGYKTGTSAIGNFAYIAGKKENGTAGNEAGVFVVGTFNSSGVGAEALRISSSSNATFTGYGAFTGVVYANSRLMVGTNTTDQDYASLFVGGAITTGVNQSAIITDPQLAGTNNYAIQANARIKASHAATNAFGVYILNSEKLAGATIVNNYGLYIANQTSGSTLNYAIYSAGGLNYFGSNSTFAASVGIGASPTKRLYVYDATSAGTDDIAMVYQALEANHAWYRSQRLNGANMVIGATRNSVDNSVPANSSIVWNQTAHNMAFGTNNLLRFTLTSGGTFNYTSSVTAASAIARGVHIQPGLVAAANNDILYGIDIRPTYDLGAFTGVKRVPFRAQLADNRWIEYNENIFYARFNDNTNVTPLVLENSYGLGFAVGILFNLGYDGTGSSVGTTVSGGRLYVSPEQNWTSTASTQDASMLFQTASNGVLGTRLSILSGGTIRLDAYSDNGFVKTSSSTGTITIDTTSYQPLLTNPVTGTGNGVAGQVAYFTGANSIDGTSAFSWSSPQATIGISDSGNNTDYSLRILRHGTLANPGTWTTTSSRALLIQDFSTDGGPTFDSSGLVSIELPRIATTDTYAGNAVAFRVATDNLTVMAAKGNGTVHIGQSGATDNGERLQVSGNVSAKGTGNYGGVIADNSSSATIGGGYFSARSFGTQRGIFGVAGAISGDTDNNIGIFSEGGLGIKFMVNGSATPAFIMTSTGRLGINESGPSSRMQINGDIRISGAGSAIDGYAGGFLDYSSGALIIRGQATTGGSIALRTSANGAANVATDRLIITSNGSSRFTNRLGVGNTADQDYASLFIGGDITAGVNQYAIILDPQLSGTSNSYGLFANARIKANTAVSNVFGVYIPSPEKLSGATITDSYALYIANQTSGSNTNYSIWSSGGRNYFGGNVSIGTTTFGNANLQVRDTNVSTGGSTLWVYGYDGAANLYTTRGEAVYNTALYLYNNPSAGQGYGTGISFRAKSDTVDSRAQGIIYTTWATATDASRTSNMVFGTTNAASSSDKMWLTGSGRLGVGQSNPSGTLHVTMTGITASAPSKGWPVFDAESDTNARSIYIDTAGNGGVATAGQGATVVLQLGQYYDSRVVITPVGSGGSSPGDQGQGRGKDLMLKAGTSDNGVGYKGGRLYLNGGMGYQSAYNANGGDIIMQGLTGSGNVMVGLTSDIGGKVQVGGQVRAENFALYRSGSFRGGIYTYDAVSGSGTDYGITIFAEGGANNGNIYFCPNGSPTKFMSITTNNEVLINTTSDAGDYKLQVNGQTYSSSGFFESSDIRLKTVLNRYNSSSFDAIEYKWNDGRDDKVHWGYAAQEVAKWLPDAVEGSEEKFYTLDYNQVHTWKIAKLEERIKQLESQLKNK